MEAYFRHLGFWAAFGRAMALAVVTFTAAALFGNTSSASVFSMMTALLLWAACSLIYAVGGRDEASRYWNETIRPLLERDKED